MREASAPLTSEEAAVPLTSEEAAVPLTSEEALQLAEAEGLTLLKAKSKTGYFGVAYKQGLSKPYQGHVTRRGAFLYLGCFATAEEAAMCVARTPEGRAAAKRAASAPPARPGPAAIEMVAQEAAEATEAEAAETAAAAGAEAEAAEAAAAAEKAAAEKAAAEKAAAEKAAAEKAAAEKAAAEKAAAEKAAAEKAADGQVSGRTRMRKTLAYALVPVSAPRAPRTVADFPPGWWAFVPRVSDHGYRFSTWCRS